MDNLSFIKEQNHWVLTSCPSTGDEVVGSGWEKNFTTPVGQARWWKCPACDGWHIMTEYDAQQKEKYPLN